jgi:hypothetical protein
VIFGRVLDADTGQPLANANVELLDGRTSSVITNALGEFAFFDVPSGNQQLVVLKTGYLWGEFGMRWAGVNLPDATRWHYPDGQLVPLAAGETKNVDVRMWKWATISGQLVDEAGDPVVGAAVEAWPKMSAGGHAWLNRVYATLAHTDDRGVFMLRPLLPGDYAVVFPSPSLTIPADRAVTPLAFRNTDTEVFRLLAVLEPVPGEARASSAFGSSRGDFRVAHLGQPVPPTPAEGGPALAYPTTFYPATISPDTATLVTVHAGERRQAINLQLAPVRTHTISGTLLSPAGPMPQTAVVLYERGSSAFAEVQVAVSFTQVDGRFAFFDVPPGSYRLDVEALPIDQVSRYNSGPSYVANAGSEGAEVRVAAPRSDRPTLWAAVPVTVGDEDVTGVGVLLQTGTRVTGRVVFDSATAHNAGSVTGLALGFDRVDGRTTSVETENEIEVGADASLRSVELPGGKYFIRASKLPSGWTLESAAWRGRDLSVVPLDCPAEGPVDVVVTLTDRPSVISGTVTIRDNAPDPNAAVVIFPRDPATWVDFGIHPRTIQTRRVDATGHYTVTGLPPGDYWIVAVDDALLSVGMGPPFLGLLSRNAAVLSVAPDTHARMDLVTQVLR